jgi:hypothetical protein
MYSNPDKIMDQQQEENSQGADLFRFNQASGTP